MNCRHAVERIARLEADETPNADLLRHLNYCADCRGVYHRLAAIARKSPLAGHASPHLTDRIMQTVRAEGARDLGIEVSGRWTRDDSYTPAGAEFPGNAARETPSPEQRIRLPGWTAGGVVILASLVLIQFSKVVAYLRDTLGSVIDVSLGIMLGLALTIYICVLVGSNLRAVQRLLRLRPR